MQAMLWEGDFRSTFLQPQPPVQAASVLEIMGTLKHHLSSFACTNGIFDFCVGKESRF